MESSNAEHEAQINAVIDAVIDAYAPAEWRSSAGTRATARTILRAASRLKANMRLELVGQEALSRVRDVLPFAMPAFSNVGELDAAAKARARRADVADPPNASTRERLMADGFGDSAPPTDARSARERDEDERLEHRLREAGVSLNDEPSIDG